jgi:hypothetical protein
MLNFDLYAIYTDKSNNVCEYFLSFNEAMKNRFKYANWLCKPGDVYIYCYHKDNPKSREHWHILSDGTIDKHFNF